MKLEVYLYTTQGEQVANFRMAALPNVGETIHWKGGEYHVRAREHYVDFVYGGHTVHLIVHPTKKGF
jgi:hypothetical protein